MRSGPVGKFQAALDELDAGGQAVQAELLLRAGGGLVADVRQDGALTGFERG